MATLVTSIVDPSNQSGTDYLGLIAWDAGEYGDLTGARDELAEAECRTSSSTADAFGSSNCSITGWTTSSTQFIRVISGSGDRPGTQLDTTKYHITYTGSNYVIVFHEDYTVFDGIQIDVSGSTGAGLRIYGYDLTNEITIQNCIIKGSSTNYVEGIYAYVESGSEGKIGNNIVYNMDGTEGKGISCDGTGIRYIYCNTIQNCDRGLWGTSSGTNHAINNIVQGSGDQSIDRANMSSSSRNNVQDDIAYRSYFGVNITTGTVSSSASNKLTDTSKNFNTLGVKVGNYLRDVTGSNSSYCTAVDSNTVLSTNDDYFIFNDSYLITYNFVGSVVFDDESGDDFALGSTDTLATENGYDLSGDSNYAIDTDILGNDRDGWDIGAHEISIAAGVTINFTATISPVSSVTGVTLYRTMDLTGSVDAVTSVVGGDITIVYVLNATSGGLAWGEESPTESEIGSPWSVWSDGAGSVPTITGDQDWGVLSVDTGEEGRSNVYDYGNSVSRTYTLTLNRYGSGSGTPVVQIRGQNTSFSQDDVSPSWETYSVPVAKTWRYMQVRITYS